MDHRCAGADEFRWRAPDSGRSDRNQSSGAACCAPTTKWRWLDHHGRRHRCAPRPSPPHAPCQPCGRGTRAHRQLDEQRQRRLRHRILDAAVARRTARPPERHTRGGSQRFDVTAVSSSRRCHRGSHLQFLIASRDGSGLSWRCACPAGRFHRHDSQTSWSHPEMMDGLSPNLQYLETSATVAISAEAKRRKAAGEDVIDLGAGEPDFATPSIPAEAGIRAIKDGKTHYSANEGILELRAAAAKHLSLLSGGRPVNADHVVISNGSKQSLFNVCFSLFGPGDVVAIPAPAWVSYPQIVHLTRARPVLIAGAPEWSLKASVQDLERMLPGATGLILCSPCNPTGAVYTHAEIRAIAQWAKAKKVWVIADEIYRRIHYGTVPSPSFLDLPDDLLERGVLITGVSQTYAMTGWRIGFALAPAKIAKAMAALQSHTTTGANHPAQFAAAAALGDDRVEQDVNRMVGEFRKRRDLVVARFRQDLPGVEFVDPLGAFYFFFRVDSFGKITGTDFCTRLITQSGVALVPGAAFGDDRWVRLSYAAATDSIKQALDRIVSFARKLGD